MQADEQQQEQWRNEKYDEESRQRHREAQAVNGDRVECAHGRCPEKFLLKCELVSRVESVANGASTPLAALAN
ncbi:hypothetical protein GCM10028811_13220 [Uliginosibacterium sediminicola]